MHYKPSVSKNEEKFLLFTIEFFHHVTICLKQVLQNPRFSNEI